VETDDEFARLIAPIKKRMFETVWRILRHSHDAEDALQVALTTIWQQRGRLESHPAPEALMLRICADAAVDHYRRRRSQINRNPLEAVVLEDPLQSDCPIPLDAVISRETHEVIVEAISQLSPNQATAIVMRFIQGESDTAIAAALGCATETVREHVKRGRERLARILVQLSQRNVSAAGPDTAELQSENKQ
jgi:RNA polymerase sigma-70 factor (ECF subfamily)